MSSSAYGPGQPAILPYARVVGQRDVKLALELAYVEPRLGGVLISGERGTAKSTVVRGFALMAWGSLPVTLPINATEDRVVGGWQVEKLLAGEPTWQQGLLEDADGRMLYVDEVNLLDDHIVNLILDAASTGVLVVQRDGKRLERAVRFSLVGTMNPEEGGLRPQLRDRFGLMVAVKAASDPGQPAAIIRARLKFEAAVASPQGDGGAKFLAEARQEDEACRRELEAARDRVAADVKGEMLPDDVLNLCVRIARDEHFRAEGHRAELVMALAARAHAAREQRKVATAADVKAVARMALQHRRREATGAERLDWTNEDQKKVDEAKP
jgi:magnesium chelatase subunit I